MTFQGPPCFCPSPGHPQASSEAARLRNQVSWAQIPALTGTVASSELPMTFMNLGFLI